MKTFTLFCLGILYISFCHAQETDSHNKYFAGASFNLSYQKNYIPSVAYTPITTIYGTYSNGTGDHKFFRSSIYALLGKQITPYWAVGGFLSAGVENNKYHGVFIGSTGTVISQYKEKEQHYGAGFFARYIINPDNALQAFIQPSFSYRWNHRSIFRDGTFSDEIKVNNFQLESRLGFLYKLNDAFRLNISIGSFYVLYGQWKDEQGLEDNFFTVGTHFNFNSLQFGGEYVF